MKGGVISFKSRKQLHRRLLTVDAYVELNRRQTFRNRNECRRQTLHSDQMNKNIYQQATEAGGDISMSQRPRLRSSMGDLGLRCGNQRQLSIVSIHCHKIYVLIVSPHTPTDGKLVSSRATSRNGSRLPAFVPTAHK